MEKKQRDREREVSADNLPPAFSHSEYRSFTVTAVSPLTADSVLFTFSLQPGHSLGLAVGQHILLRCVSTPCSGALDNIQGHIISYWSHIMRQAVTRQVCLYTTRTAFNNGVEDHTVSLLTV